MGQDPWRLRSDVHLFTYKASSGGSRFVIRITSTNISAYPDTSFILFSRQGILAYHIENNSNYKFKAGYVKVLVNIMNGEPDQWTYPIIVSEDQTYVDIKISYSWDEIVLIGKSQGVHVTKEAWYD